MILNGISLYHSNNLDSKAAIESSLIPASSLHSPRTAGYLRGRLCNGFPAPAAAVDIFGNAPVFFGQALFLPFRLGRMRDVWREQSLKRRYRRERNRFACRAFPACTCFGIHPHAAKNVRNPNDGRQFKFFPDSPKTSNATAQTSLTFFGSSQSPPQMSK